MSQPVLGGSELIEGGRLRSSQSSEGSDLLQSPSLITSPFFSASYGSPSDPSGRDPDFSEYCISISFISSNRSFHFLDMPSENGSSVCSGMSPSALAPRLSNGLQSGDVLDSNYPPCDYIPCNMDQLDEDGDRCMFKSLSSKASVFVYFSHISSIVLICLSTWAHCCFAKFCQNNTANSVDMSAIVTNVSHECWKVTSCISTLFKLL